MAEVYFYHMTRTPLEVTLPLLLGKCRARGLRALIRAPQRAMLEALETRLWARQEGAEFFPLGWDGDAEEVLLATDPASENNADILFLIAGAPVDGAEAARRQRVCYLFDGENQSAVESAREQWKSVLSQGIAAVYWAQGPGGWQEKARQG